MTMITKDSGYVIYDKQYEVYFCGMNKWDKQPRKALIYHSENYVKSALEDIVRKGKDRKNLILLNATVKIN